MRQRVGFARAQVVDLELLFMDEPFSALDVLTAANLRKELLGLWQSKSMPTRAIVMVTHKIDEAVSMADLCWLHGTSVRESAVCTSTISFSSHFVFGNTWNCAEN